ncbi:glycoside hydrolase family 20 zincin-like fold domain-containing protein [uncultured Parabacteroides sp.]|uniref:glycoside hydrolase family 20 zincin-like fold domain-containing protein n=1 Tax=uncultured Parabacteroides sp. TaxID=512312 RepID=UPI00259B5343|nr:glycoside hydrolase family 20 zincin-like fold domain-containing protein [uncultured Parabacteroides sp.]
MKTTLFACLLFVTGSLFARNLDKTFQLLPQPQSVEVLSGKGLSFGELSYVSSTEGTSIPVLGEIVDGLPQSKRSGKGVRFQLSTTNVPDSPEGYVLEISDKGVIVTSRDNAGLFYGAQTLEQLLEDSRDFKKEIPSMKITDYPAIAYRAVHLDTKHHLDRMEYYYRMVDKLARYKVNAIIWELEDKLRFTRRPEAGAPNAISKQEMQALCRYAKERNVEISPLVQGLGHAGFILKHHWELRENPASDWEFCPSDPRTYEVQFDLYLDALEAMPYGRYLHVGGDEITAIGIDDRCKATGKSAFELQMVWLKKVCQFAVDHGRIPIFWDDMPLKYADLWELALSDKTEEEVAKEWNTEKLDKAIDLFPKECVYMRWKYEDATAPAHRKLLKWYSDKGLKVMGATAASAGDSPFLPRNNTRAGYVKGFSQLVAENHLEGILATAWDDGSPHLETVWRGYIAQGEFGWNPTARDIETFKKVHAQREYGFRPEENRMQFLDELEKAIFFFDGALVTSGRRNPAWGTTAFTLMELPDKANPGTWSETYKEKITKAKEEAKRYELIADGVRTAEKNALRNRYTLEVYEQTNNLQNYPTRLILALNEYDTAKDAAARKAALDKVVGICNNFKEMRSNLEAVYSETRFMQQPEGFIADMNHHNHLSSKTENSDWLYLYEIPMIKKVLQWANQ